MPRTQTRGPILDHAKAMRRELIAAEARLWYHLRAKRLNGVKFSRQVVIGSFIVDFAARSDKLAIELDGDTHVDEARDARRTAAIATSGYRVIRFTNIDVTQNEAAVLQAISAALAPPPLPSPLLASEEREKDYP